MPSDGWADDAVGARRGAARGGVDGQADACMADDRTAVRGRGDHGQRHRAGVAGGRGVVVGYHGSGLSASGGDDYKKIEPLF